MMRGGAGGWLLLTPSPESPSSLSSQGCVPSQLPERWDSELVSPDGNAAKQELVLCAQRAWAELHRLQPELGTRHGARGEAGNEAGRATARSQREAGEGARRGRNQRALPGEQHKPAFQLEELLHFRVLNFSAPS